VSFLYSLFAVCINVLELSLVVFLARGSLRKYPIFSAYAVAAFAADLTETVAYYRLGWASENYRELYWASSIVLDLLLFLLVIGLTYTALEGSLLRPTAGKILAAVTVVGLALPFVLLPNHHSNHHGSFTTQWFNHVSQIFDFAAAILTLVLWAALLTNRKRDPQLVSLSIGLGLLTTAGAIAWGARRWLGRDNRWPVDVFMNLAQIASLLVWCWVFRPRPRRSTGATPPASGATPPPPNALTTPS
jgi:hypothetical protein